MQPGGSSSGGVGVPIMYALQILLGATILDPPLCQRAALSETRSVLAEPVPRRVDVGRDAGACG